LRKRRKKVYVRAKKIPDLKNVLKELSKNENFRKGLERAEIMNAWGAIAGKRFSDISHPVRYKNYVLYVKVNSAVWRNEIYFLEKDLIRRMNEHFKRTVITKIILV